MPFTIAFSSSKRGIDKYRGSSAATWCASTSSLLGFISDGLIALAISVITAGAVERGSLVLLA